MLKQIVVQRFPFFASHNTLNRSFFHRHKNLVMFDVPIYLILQFMTFFEIKEKKSTLKFVPVSVIQSAS